MTRIVHSCELVTQVFVFNSLLTVRNFLQEVIHPLPWSVPYFQSTLLTLFLCSLSRIFFVYFLFIQALPSFRVRLQYLIIQKSLSENQPWRFF